MTTDEASGNQVIEPEPTGDEAVRHRPNRFVTVLVLGLVISVVAVALLSTRSRSVRVPDLTGLTVDPNSEVARTVLETHDLVLGDVAVEQCDSLQLPNTVTDQTPVPGTSVPRGTAVAITICHSDRAPADVTTVPST